MSGIDPIPPPLAVVDVTGTARGRGRAHGEELRSSIREVIDRWREVIALDVGPGVDAYIEGLLSETDFVRAIRRWTPDLLDEVSGIADGAAIPEATCLAWQLLDEEWWYRERHLGREVAEGERCSTAGGRSAGAGTVIGQNMDIESYHDGSQVLLRSIADGTTPAIQVLTTAGMIGLTGLNRAGVGVCCNSLPQLTKNAAGLPVAFVIRGVLERPTLAEAGEFVRGVTHASGQNYLVGGPDGFLDLECSGGLVSEVEPAGDRVVHTNHPLANDDFVERTVAPETTDTRIRAPRSTTRERYAVLSDRLVDRKGELTVERLRETLADRSAPVSVVGSAAESFMTFGSVVMELSADPVLHLAPGPPDRTAYRRHTFDDGKMT